MDRALLRRLMETADSGQEAVFCLVVDEQDSTPRGRGASMLVFADGSIDGTIGGGVTEHRVIERALVMLEEEKECELYTESLAASNPVSEDAACGGRLSVYMERFGRSDEILIFGAGHVGRALARLADASGIKVTVWDERAAFANAEYIPWGRTLACPLNEIPIDGIIRRSSVYAVIVTRGHALDGEAVKFLEGKACAWIGMIGSRRKIAFLKKRLLEEGVGAEFLDRIEQPVGLPLRAETPEEIAVSILAGIIAVRRRADVKKLRAGWENGG